MAKGCVTNCLIIKGMLSRPPEKQGAWKDQYRTGPGSGGGLELFIACIQMDADADHGSQEGIVLFPVDPQTMQAIVIEDAVVDPFCCRTLVVNLFIGIRAARDIRIQTDIPIRPCFDDPAVFGGGTRYLAF